jgi:HSP20 family protein
MTKIKRSFLERLTGSKRIEPEESYTDEIAIRPSTNFYQEETEISMNSSFNSNQPKNMNEENILSNDSSEGQLTIDVYQTESDIVIKSTIAGVKPEDLDVAINNDMVTIKGERKNEEQVPEKIEASMKNGILTVRLPKADVNKTKKIQVRGF